MSKEWLNNIATINESKSGNLYIKVNRDFSVKEGATLMLKNKKQEILESAQAGKISEERAQELVEKLGFIKYVIHMPPQEEN
jgi:hypothetical protein